MVAGTREKLVKAVLRVDCRSGTGKDSAQNTQGQAGGRRDISRDAFDQLHQNEAGIQGQGRRQDADAGREDEDIKNGIITVQYNPASIQYSAGISEHTDVKSDIEEGRTVQITTITSESTIDMSFTLEFHQKTPKDSSVREQMELVMDMVCNSPTKWVDFSWADIHMEGKLVSFSGAYDMFDRAGNPLSGHMDLTIEASTKAESTSRILGRLEDRRRDKRKKQDEEACGT